jgi:hypothetical protein
LAKKREVETREEAINLAQDAQAAQARVAQVARARGLKRGDDDDDDINLRPRDLPKGIRTC